MRKKIWLVILKILQGEFNQGKTSQVYELTQSFTVFFTTNIYDLKILWMTGTERTFDGEKGLWRFKAYIKFVDISESLEIEKIINQELVLRLRKDPAR